MDADFWHERWRNNQIGFHRASVNPHLTRFWPTLELSAAASVFVPLCGKSRDLLWLTQQGHPVLGVELDELAVGAFFEEQSLPTQVRRDGPFQIWRSVDITLLCGDFFSLSESRLSTVEAVYDRAALIALPPAMRQDYVRHFQSVVPTTARVLLITLEYDQAEMSGPPFSVHNTEVEQLYGERYNVELLFDHDALANEPHFRDKGVTVFREKVYRLIPRHPI